MQWLVEARMLDMGGDEVVRLYEVTEGTYYHVYAGSGNAYWHSKESYEASEYLSAYSPHDTRHFMVTSEGGFVGVWVSMERFMEFLHLYMRAEVLETLEV